MTLVYLKNRFTHSKIVYFSFVRRLFDLLGYHGRGPQTWPHGALPGTPPDPVPSEAVLRVPTIPPNATGSDGLREGAKDPSGKDSHTLKTIRSPTSV